jgi:hypothetical protein
LPRLSPDLPLPVGHIPKRTSAPRYNLLRRPFIWVQVAATKNRRSEEEK